MMVKDTTSPVRLEMTGELIPDTGQLVNWERLISSLFKQALSEEIKPTGELGMTVAAERQLAATRRSYTHRTPRNTRKEKST